MEYTDERVANAAKAYAIVEEYAQRVFRAKTNSNDLKAKADLLRRAYIGDYMENTTPGTRELLISDETIRCLRERCQEIINKLEGEKLSAFP